MEYKNFTDEELLELLKIIREMKIRDKFEINIEVRINENNNNKSK